MSASHTRLDAAASERKARLAKLASLKRKQPGSDTTEGAADSKPEEQSIKKTDNYLSGRNYDTETKGPRLGFENAPSTDVETLEKQADRIAISTTEQAAKDEAEAEKGIDLFKLQPKKPNWDLKRELAERMKPVNIKTQNAIARLVRERIENAKKDALKKGKEQPPSVDDEQGEEVGIEGTALVEGLKQMEREEEEEVRREREEEKELEAEGIP